MTKRLLVCDLDNTLYDWVGYFVPAFYAMVDETVRLTGCDKERLLDEFRGVHREHHDSEHPFALLETATIQEKYAGLTRKQMAEELDSAFHAFNSSRKRNLALFPGVHRSLDILSSIGYVLIAHTESRLYAAIDRLNRLELIEYFTRIYCRERPQSQHPDVAAGKRWLSEIPLQKITELSHHQRKPDPDVLLEICHIEGIRPADAAYVGDSMARDVMMAKSANVFAIWAEYGSHLRGDYEKLVRITHWTDDDVAREKLLREQAASVQPDAVLKTGFDEILNVLAPRHRQPQIATA